MKNMKRLMILLTLVVSLLPQVWATDGGHQHRMSFEEFQAKHRAFLIEKAGLTQQEADKFFPLYDEMNKLKKEISDESWKLLRHGKKADLSDAEYEKIMQGYYEARIKTDNLEKQYYEKFKKFLSPKKLYNILKAEMRFQREMVKNMNSANKNKK